MPSSLLRFLLEHLLLHEVDAPTYTQKSNLPWKHVSATVFRRVVVITLPEQLNSVQNACAILVHSLSSHISRITMKYLLNHSACQIRLMSSGLSRAWSSFLPGCQRSLLLTWRSILVRAAVVPEPSDIFTIARHTKCPSVSLYNFSASAIAPGPTMDSTFRGNVSSGILPQPTYPDL